MVEIIAEKSELAIEKLIAALDSGKAVSFPTETVYALACDAYQESAVEEIYKIKGRDPSKPLSIIVDSLDFLRDILDITPEIEEMASKYMPGALTIVAKVKADSLLAKNINNGAGTIGFRIPDHEFCLKLLKKLRRPLVATSVNFSGEVSLTNAKDISDQFSDKLALIIDGGESKRGIPSTVVDMSKNQKVILRQGILQID